MDLFCWLLVLTKCYTLFAQANKKDGETFDDDDVDLSSGSDFDEDEDPDQIGVPGKDDAINDHFKCIRIIFEYYLFDFLLFRWRQRFGNSRCIRQK